MVSLEKQYISRSKNALASHKTQLCMKSKGKNMKRYLELRRYVQGRTEEESVGVSHFLRSRRSIWLVGKSWHSGHDFSIIPRDLILLLCRLIPPPPPIQKSFGTPLGMLTKKFLFVGPSLMRRYQEQG